MDDVTGLHAFDHLDPVSALNVLPDEPEPAVRPVQRSQPAPRRADVRPPPPAFRGRSLPPPPPPRGGPAGMSVPPPPPMRSFAPPAVGPGDLAPPRLAQPARPVPSPSSPSWAHARAAASAARTSQPPVADDDLTQRVAIEQLAPRAELDDTAPTSLFPVGQRDEGDDAQPQSFDGLDDPRTSPHALMDYSATSVATSIDMDWDEDEEPQTNMRDELQGAPARASSTDFDPVVHVPATAPASFMPPSAAAARPSLLPAPVGQPSPFVQASSLAQPEPQSWEDDAETRVHNPVTEVIDASWARSGASTLDTMVGDDDAQPSKMRIGMPWLALAGVLAVGLALGVRAMMAPPALATVTLVTQPADAQVSVDGRPLVGQTSPFTIQGLAPESEHSLVVRAEGHGEHTSRFRVEPGETKALSTVELTPVRVDTGFTLTSQPVGAAVFVDGQALELQTPVRITDLKPGLHTVRLERGAGFLPWETQVAIAAGQVIELSPAQLAPSSAVKDGDSGGSEQARLERKARRAERRAERAAARAEAAAAKKAQRAARSSAASARVVRAPAVAAPAPAVAGGGTLRVNSRPWSQVFVDGKLRGNTPQLGISLSPGTHKLKLVSPDLGLTKQMTVKIEKGKTVTKVVNLVE